MFDMLDSVVVGEDKTAEDVDTGDGGDSLTSSLGEGLEEQVGKFDFKILQ